MFNWGNNSGDSGDTSDSGSLWIKMLGLGPLVEAIRNPETLQMAFDMMRSVIQSQMAQARIEAKLDIVLREAGHDVDAINRRVAEQFANGGGPVVTINGLVVRGDASGPVVPQQQRPAGDGGHPAASGAAHHGGEAPARHHRRTNGKG